MKKLFILGLLLFYIIIEVSSKPIQNELTLWYTTPAKDWMTNALPIGNGRLGAMIFGGVEKEQIQFNDKTLWSGSTSKRGSYENFGDIYIHFEDHADYSEYKRELSLDNAIATVKYKSGGVSYQREYFSSNPDDAIVMRLSANKKGKISFKLKLDDIHNGQMQVKNNQIIFGGKLTLLSYKGILTLLNEGGEVSTENSFLVVRNADAVNIILAGGTNYDPSGKNYLTTGNWEEKLESVAREAIHKKYAELKRTHLEDYHALFDRVSLNIGDKKPLKPTDQLLADYSQGKIDPALDVLFFQYGRYLTIASSRQNLDLPSNLQGIWNNSNNPPWESDIHSNINVQMNYWPVEVANLSECHLPFINYIYNEVMIQPSWRIMASELGCRGWAIKTQNNIFGYSDWLWNRPANGWYCMHLWDRYTFNPDSVYLKDVAYPVMKSACEFWLDRLFMDDQGKWIAPNEWSPEHGPWENGIAYVQQIIWDLFDNTIKAGKIIGTDTEFIDLLEKYFDHLDNGLHIGNWGQLREWKYTEDDSTNKHRHVSHLIALYPGKAISPILNPEYADAAKRILEARGDGGTGWSRVWKIAFWARLLDGDHAHKLLQNALKLSTDNGMEYMNGGGVYENLLDAHPPFQIDGNLGVTACISELFLQSHLEEIHLLPALPDAWKNGEIRGLRARGAFEVNLKWKNKKLIYADVFSGQGGKCKLRTSVPVKIKGVDVVSQKDDKGYYITSFMTVKGQGYQIIVD